ncbi:MAG: NADH-quinone oxidoreductase subunit H, partial [Saprospiraceae bacterium]|nr:NADH-quinone oxidoreductase subunit H [Saprospiraceae bacterium]
MLFLFSIVIHWLVILVLAPLFLGAISRVKAFFSGKRGPSVFQPYFDLMKLFRKQCVYSRTTTWVSRAAPCVVFAATMA